MATKISDKLINTNNAPNVTLSEEQLVGPRRGAGPRSPQALVAQGLSSCAQALVGVVSRAGAKDQAW